MGQIEGDGTPMAACVGMQGKDTGTNKRVLSVWVRRIRLIRYVGYVVLSVWVRRIRLIRYVGYVLLTSRLCTALRQAWEGDQYQDPTQPSPLPRRRTPLWAGRSPRQRDVPRVLQGRPRSASVGVRYRRPGRRPSDLDPGLDDALATKPAGLVAAIILLAGFAEPAALSVAVKPDAALLVAATALVLATGRSPRRVWGSNEAKAPLAGHVLAKSARAASPPRLCSRLFRLCRRGLLLLLLTSCPGVLGCPSPRAVRYVLAPAYTPRMDLRTPALDVNTKYKCSAGHRASRGCTFVMPSNSMSSSCDMRDIS
jgi:hypothetical protein